MQSKESNSPFYKKKKKKTIFNAQNQNANNIKKH